MLFGRSDGLQLPTLQQSVDPALQDGERKNLCCSKKKKLRTMKQIHLSKTKSGHELIGGPACCHTSHEETTEFHASSVQCRGKEPSA